MGYYEEMDTVDASVFSGELLHTHLDVFEVYVSRWQRAIDSHKASMEEDGNDEA